MLTFLAAVYNEEAELRDLISSVVMSVDGFAIVDDGSTDRTSEILEEAENALDDPFGQYFNYKVIEHTGLPETVKNEALQLVPDGSWVLMLDADERVSPMVLESIHEFLDNPTADYVYFQQFEIIDGKKVRVFQKCKLFRKESIQFPLNNIHADDQFTGEGDYREDWIVTHRKTTTKQILRETEYLNTYKKLLDEGHIDEGRYQWLTGLHHYVRPHG